MRILGIDPGSVRIGLAISDPDRRIASPLATYERRDAKQDAAYFKKVVAKEEIAVIVIGLPTREDGYEGEQAKIVRTFGSWLAEVTGVPCEYYDERYTTAAAESALLGAGLTKKQRQARRDRVAAQMLLQAYLDAILPSPPGRAVGGEGGLTCEQGVTYHPHPAPLPGGEGEIPSPD